MPPGLADERRFASSSWLHSRRQELQCDEAFQAGISRLVDTPMPPHQAGQHSIVADDGADERIGHRVRQQDLADVSVDSISRCAAAASSRGKVRWMTGRTRPGGRERPDLGQDPGGDRRLLRDGPRDATVDPVMVSGASAHGGSRRRRPALTISAIWTSRPSVASTDTFRGT
jgi:hypothetical protein